MLYMEGNLVGWTLRARVSGDGEIGGGDVKVLGAGRQQSKETKQQTT
jgi:hypothetical protein